MIINGKDFATAIRLRLKDTISGLVKKGLRTPSLAVILVGDDPASQVYVSHKEKACAEVGILGRSFRLPKDSTESQVKDLVRSLNDDPTIDGILVQLPLPSHLSSDGVIAMIAPEKDVDGLTAMNQGLLAHGKKALVPCTPLGCVELIKAIMPTLRGKVAVVIGRSILVGSPVAKLLMQEDATVIQIHSRTKNPEELSRLGDILVVAAGKKHLVTASWVKPGAIVIDVGIHRGDDGKLTGDVDFNSVQPLAGAITPVPGGVGPMTIAMLLSNCLKAYQIRNDL